MALAQSSNRLQQSYMAQQGMSRGGPSGLADVLDVLLDKGLVIDAFVRVSLVGIELLTIDARVVIASVDTYLRFAEAVNRLDLLQVNNSKNLGDLMGGGSSGSRALSSRGRTKSSQQEDSESNADDEDTDDAHDEPSRSDEGNEPEATAGEDATEDDATQDDGEDKGILTRIKERGQVF